MTTGQDQRRRQVLGVCAFLLLLAGVIGSGLLWLEHLAVQADRLPVLLYEQPLWSGDEARLAYFRIPCRPEDGRLAPLSKELWWTARVGDSSVQLTEFPADSPVRLLGFMGENTSVVLKPEGAPEEPSFLMIGLGNRKLQKVRFEREGLAFVGLRGQRLYFQRQLESVPVNAASAEGAEPLTEGGSPEAGAPALLGRGVELLSWRASSRGFRHLVTIPFTSLEELSVEEVLPSPDDRFLAVVLRLGGEDGALGLWVYDRDEERLVWTSVRSQAEAMHLAWSPESRGLLAATQKRGSGELFVLENVLSRRYERLASGAGRITVLPFWPRGHKGFVLQMGNELFRLDPDTLRTEMLLDKHVMGLNPQDVAVSPMANWAVFHARGLDQDDLYVASLSTLQTRPLLPPGKRRKARESLLYQVAEGTRYALSRWRGGSPGEAGE